jgi:hypothetical protein
MSYAKGEKEALTAMGASRWLDFVEGRKDRKGKKTYQDRYQ